jgi:hypothetical protein
MAWVIFMILSIVIVWGGLAASIMYAVKKSRAAK